MVDAPHVKKILYITLSNLGDAMMALPAFDFLKREHPGAHMTVVAGPRTKCIFENHPDVDHLIIFDKSSSLRQKIRLFFQLQKTGFDAIVDLKNTFYRWGLKAFYKNPVNMRYPAWAAHYSQKHLLAAMATFRGSKIDQEEFLAYYNKRNPSFVACADTSYIQQFLKDNGVSAGDAIAVVVPGSRSSLKQWDQTGFVKVVGELKTRLGFKVILTGTSAEAAVTRHIAHSCGSGVIDMAGKTDFKQLCALILAADLVVCNDSGVLHIASYLDRFLVGIFGPTDYAKYGPWSAHSMAVRKSPVCAPCEEAHCRNQLECLRTITSFDVLLAVDMVLEGRKLKSGQDIYKRILVVRTDRIGDVLISTPVIKVLRQYFPLSHIAMMVSPYTKELLEGNPFLDDVIVLDKDERHRGFLATLKFVAVLKKQKFDLAIILHPTLRTHMICFLADIKERIGYDRKAPYFLSKAVPHRKQEGKKHEVEYNFDLLKPLGIDTVDRQLYVPIKKSSEDFVDEALKKAGIALGEKIVAVNPAASCISKRWPVSRFAELIDRLRASHQVKVVIVADAAHRGISDQLMRMTQSNPVDFSGVFSLSQLASLFRRCALVVSNDSGPVHLAVAVGTPVISIFGRNQPGLSPLRWGPLGRSDVVIHKKTDCLTCLAHACEDHFKCLEAISVEEVLGHAQRLLGQTDKKYKDISFFPEN